jgi:hypothetical protein
VRPEREDDARRHRTVMVPDLEIHKKVSKIDVFGRKQLVVPRYYIIIMTSTKSTLPYIYVYIDDGNACIWQPEMNYKEVWGEGAKLNYTKVRKTCHT